jgi:CheY-like chemotaxis protein
MATQVNHLSRLVDDLLDVSRITSGKIDLRDEPVELAEVVNRAVETARPLIYGKGHTLSISLPPGPVLLRADPVRIAQVLANLLNNAAKYMDEGGRITLACERAGEEVTVSVGDAGIGIDAEMLPRIFDLFTQADRSLDRSQGGLGIGLSLVRKLVELHGGTVVARSEGLGEGSEFIVRLPALREGVRPGPPGWRPSPTRRLRVLVVDDNTGAALVLARLLAKVWGHEVEVAHDGPAALELASGFRPELILLDIGLPGMSGYEVTMRLRGRDGFEGVMIVALTGYGQEEDRRRSQDGGFDGHLVKPVEAETLEALYGHPKPRVPGGKSP